MCEDLPPIEPGERLLRKIPIGPGTYDPQLPQPLSAGAFSPHPRDIDGLSFFRERFISPTELVTGHPTRPPDKWVVATVTIDELRLLDLTVEPLQEEGDGPGHVVIRDFAYTLYKGPATKERVRGLIQKVTALATNDRIIRFTDTTPTRAIEPTGAPMLPP
jgi:hypothetical protein